MKDAEETRKAPKNWREYLRETVEMLSVLRWTYRELKAPDSGKWTRRFWTVLVFATVFQMAQPWTIGYIFDGLIARDPGLLGLGFGGFVICALLQKVAHWQEACTREWMLGLNMGSVDHKITDLMFQKSMGQHLQEGSSLHVSNIDKGRWRAVETMIMLLFDGVPMLLMLSVSYLFLWCLSPVAGGIMTVIILVFAAWSLYLSQQTLEVCTPIEADFRQLNRHRVERWEKMERVKTSGKEDEELRGMDGWWDRMITADRNFWLWYIGQGTLRGALHSFGLLLIMAHGAWLVWNGTWEAGRLYPLYAWATLLAQNLWQLSMIERKLNWNMPSIRSMMEALTIQPDVTQPDNAAVLDAADGVCVEFDGASYTYPLGSREEGGSDKKLPVQVIKNVSFVIRPGEKVGLIGGSGAGKTTLMRLLLRYMDPDEGSIRINGQRLSDIDLASWLRLVGYIPQQAMVLDGTLRYNLTYGLPPEEREQITDEELWAIMRLLQIDFGERLVNGLDTAVGRNGMKLSGGQAQRLMIGAAAIKKPRFMVIDEATSSLDSTTEKAVQEGLTLVLNENVSALIIAHRLSTVRYLCDRFVVLRDTSSREDGELQVEAVADSFESLYDISPTFRQLADDQGVNVASHPLERILIHNRGKANLQQEVLTAADAD